MYTMFEINNNSHDVKWGGAKRKSSFEEGNQRPTKKRCTSREEKTLDVMEMFMEEPEDFLCDFEGFPSQGIKLSSEATSTHSNEIFRHSADEEFSKLLEKHQLKSIDKLCHLSVGSLTDESFEESVEDTIIDFEGFNNPNSKKSIKTNSRKSEAMKKPKLKCSKKDRRLARKKLRTAQARMTNMHGAQYQLYEHLKEQARLADGIIFHKQTKKLNISYFPEDDEVLSWPVIWHLQNQKHRPLTEKEVQYVKQQKNIEFS